MRITAGQLRGRVLHVPNLPGLRPTPSKVREALFNILGDIEDWSMLDLFSGTGIMAIEALSRGVVSASSIEQQHAAVQAMKTYSHELGLSDWTIIKGRLPNALLQLESNTFDLIFADPPYDQGVAEQIPAWLDNQHIQCRQLVIEESSHANPRWPEGWTTGQSRRYGDTCLYFLTPEK